METTEQDFGLRIISLRDLWDVFVRGLVFMLLAAVLVAGGAFAYNHFTYEPRYESKATLYLLRQVDGEEEQSSSNAYNNFNLSLKLVNDCDYLIKSHSVLDKVIATLRLDMTYDELYRSITVANPEETRILEVVVEADTPQEAKRIVDEVCDVATVAISDAMGFEQVNLYEYGVLDNEPSNAVSLTMYAILGLLAAVVVYALFLVRFLLDDRIRSDEDIQRYLGLSLLGDIPNADMAKNGKKGRYGGYYGNVKPGAAAGPVGGPAGGAAGPVGSGGVAGPGGAAASPVQPVQPGQPGQGPHQGQAAGRAPVKHVNPISANAISSVRAATYPSAKKSDKKGR